MCGLGEFKTVFIEQWTFHVVKHIYGTAAFSGNIQDIIVHNKRDMFWK